MSKKIRKQFELYYEDPETADLAIMHQKFWGDQQLQPSMGDKEYLLARCDFIQEELDELRAAIESGDYPEMIDALVDIVVVCKGSAVLMGFRWGRHWNEVMRANIEKEPGSVSKRPGMKHDLVKPPGWSGPNHLAVLSGDAGFGRIR